VTCRAPWRAPCRTAQKVNFLQWVPDLRSPSCNNTHNHYCGIFPCEFQSKWYLFGLVVSKGQEIIQNRTNSKTAKKIQIFEKKRNSFCSFFWVSSAKPPTLGVIQHQCCFRTGIVVVSCIQQL
jgi:hypothetical protein